LAPLIVILIIDQFFGGAAPTWARIGYYGFGGLALIFALIVNLPALGTRKRTALDDRLLFAMTMLASNNLLEVRLHHSG
jgi:hypothetical protein